MSGSNRSDYDILNLIGYGLAKFDMAFVNACGHGKKAAFYDWLIGQGVAKSMPAIRGRRDLLDPFFDNGRVGWTRKGNQYLHRKLHLDSLFGELDATQYAQMIRGFVTSGSVDVPASPDVSPIVRSKFRQLQLTGKEAEFYFQQNFQEIPAFAGGVLEDARFLGDGYDFQIQDDDKFKLAEVKGVKMMSGNFRMTEREYLKALEYKGDYGLIVVSNLADNPKMTAIFNPAEELRLRRNESVQTQVTYHSENLSW